MKGKSTVLIVDDEEMARDITEGFLFSEGYQLAFAGSGQEALAYLEETIPDVILLDVMMPDVDGFEVCRRVKANKQWRHIPIILVTALGGTEDLVRGLEAGADEFLHKPVNDQELRARVRSMLRIKKQYDELQTALNLREDLAHMIVHDMRTPLTAIIGYSELLLMYRNIAPQVLKTIDKIRTQANEMQRFINDLLTVAKMEEGRLTLNRSPVDVSEIVQTAEENYRVIARLKKIKILLNLPAKTRQISLDKPLFQRMLDNLISNALKFSPGETTVTLRVEYPESPGPQLRLRVLDQGPGIAPGDRELIFDKFEVAGLKQKGTAQVGLGLAFCKKVVEAHGGRIFVEANQPVGSVFIVEI